ncbi:MAG: right-handed parallel beta-helix repeat-containing protein [Phycisphaeraceae bacterium]
MRRLLHLQWFLCVVSAFACVRPALAEGTYMVFEQEATGVTTQRALDTTRFADGFDPVIAFLTMERPTDPNTAQVLWSASKAPVVWERGRDDNRFELVRFALLPDGGQIQYRVFPHKSIVELGVHRHARTAADRDWRIHPNILGRLSPGEYNIEARVVVPGRPVAKLTQRLNVIEGAEVPDPDPDPDPDPKPDPDPDPDPNDPGDGGGVGVPPVAAGFTKLVKDPDTLVVYVSDSQGNDQNDGRTPQTAVKTLKRGIELVRLGKPDWLLLKAGDTWQNQHLDGIMVGGSGADRPFVIGAYGNGARPMIIPPHGSNGIKTNNHELAGLVIQGLHIYGATRDPASPKYVGRPGDVEGISIRIGAGGGKYAEGVVIEDCVITHFDNNIIIADDWSRFQGEGVPGRIQVTIRRNILRFATTDDSHAIGIYLEGTRDSIVEQNLIDHNGWTPKDGVKARNKRSHNIYAQWANGPITIRHNIITRAAAAGLQLRAGGNIEHNLFVRNATAFWASINDSKANYNIVLEGDDMNPNVPENWRGMGIEGWGMDRYEVIGNIVARRVGTLQRPGIDISSDKVIVKNNTVYKWQDERVNMSYNVGGSAVFDANIAKELFPDNLPPKYVDPERGLATYAATLGLDKTNEAFIDYAATRPRGTWPDELAPATVADYIRAGFQLAN